MLKSLLAIFINIIFLSVFWRFIKNISIGEPPTNFAFYGVLVIISLVYLIYIIVFKLILINSNQHIFVKALSAGIILSIFVFILTNTLVMVRPKLLETNYLLNLLLAFGTGFILPYSENLIKSIFKPKKTT